MNPTLARNLSDHFAQKKAKSIQYPSSIWFDDCLDWFPAYSHHSIWEALFRLVNEAQEDTELNKSLQYNRNVTLKRYVALYGKKKEGFPLWGDYLKAFPQAEVYEPWLLGLDEGKALLSVVPSTDDGLPGGYYWLKTKGHRVQLGNAHGLYIERDFTTSQRALQERDELHTLPYHYLGEEFVTKQYYGYTRKRGRIPIFRDFDKDNPYQTKENPSGIPGSA